MISIVVPWRRRRPKPTFMSDPVPLAYAWEWPCLSSPLVSRVIEGRRALDSMHAVVHPQRRFEEVAVVVAEGERDRHRAGALFIMVVVVVVVV